MSRKTIRSAQRGIMWTVLSLALMELLSGCGESGSTSPTTVSGVVNDEVGAPVAGAQVTAVSSTSSALSVSSAKAAVVTTLTGPAGTYTVTVPEGVAQLAIAAQGYDPQTGTPVGPAPMNFDVAGRRPPHERMDADGDGVVSQSEWTGPAEIFVKIDTDADGALSKAELEAAHKDRQKHHPRRAKMDTDGDGMISRSEWLGPVEHFDEIDADASGMLTRDELHAAMKRRGPPRPRS